jgi:hypothetical protein
MPKLIRQDKCRRKCADTRRAPYAPVIADALRRVSRLAKSHDKCKEGEET